MFTYCLLSYCYWFIMEFELLLLYINWHLLLPAVFYSAFKVLCVDLSVDTACLW